jgi:hypothetical protein
MVSPLCPWSGAPCCGCCLNKTTFPWKVNGKIPESCRGWRAWTRQQAFTKEKE